MTCKSSTKCSQSAYFPTSALKQNRPAHVYTYTFEPKPDWSSFYASHKEIRQYFEEFADKYDLRKYIQLNTKVERAVWDEEQGQCT